MLEQSLMRMLRRALQWLRTTKVATSHAYAYAFRIFVERARATIPGYGAVGVPDSRLQSWQLTEQNFRKERGTLFRERKHPRLGRRWISGGTTS
jgi:hypothetical protein